MCEVARLLLILAATLAFAVPAAAQEFPERGTAPVVDAANIIDDATEAALTKELAAFEQRSQRQFVIATIPDLQGYEIADYAYQLGRYWELGDAERDDGVVMVVAPNERRMWIATGYGIEGIMPDGLIYEYIEGMKPYFRAGDYSGGISWGAGQVISQLELPPEEAARIAEQATQERASDSGFPFGALIWGGFLVFFIIVPMLSGRGRRRRYRRGGVGGAVGDVILWSALGAAMGGDGDGGGFGGGGFGGGGLGGFSGGGGSFGGGGAGGGW